MSASKRFEIGKLIKWAHEVPAVCDLNPRHTITTVFVDGKTKNGPWARMCVPCHNAKGVGLGLGKGQKYVKLDGENFYNTEG